MKATKRIFRKLDFFGVPFSLRYNDEEKYSTSIGGLFSIAFCVVVVVVGIYYFIPFFNRKNFSIVYYSMNLSSTEQIKLKESKAAFSIGLECEDAEDGTKAEDLFDLSLRFTIFKKDKDGNKIKTYEDLATHPCNYSDFYNNYNDSLDILDMDKFHCLDNTDNVIEGIYTDEVFTYYEFTVSSKEDSQTNFQKIDDYLISNDCKLEVYYSDLTIDLDNYENPIQPYLNSIFIQINPSLYLKMNAYFMNQYFINDNYLVFNFGEDPPIVKTLFSRVEQYSLYKGVNRYATKPTNYKNYAKLYIRADTKKTIINRKYQKIMEFYADSSSILLALFDILGFIFTFINGFYAEHSFSKKLFFFKEVENNHLDIYKRSKQIKELINLTESLSLKLPTCYTIQRKNSLGKETECAKDMENEEIKIFNKKKKKKLVLKEKNQLSTEKKLQNAIENIEINLDRKKPKKKKKKKIGSRYETQMKSIEENKKTSQNMHISPGRNEFLVSGATLNKSPFPELSRNFSTKFSQEEFTIQQQKPEKTEFSYNVFEIFISKFFCCCMSRRLRLKKKITEKANNILYNKLDIVLFMRNMILLDIMSKLLVDTSDNKNGIIKFLSKPVISVAKKEQNELDKSSKTYNETDFDNFYYEISELVQKAEKRETEKKLLSLSNQQLKELVNKYS